MDDLPRKAFVMGVRGQKQSGFHPLCFEMQESRTLTHVSGDEERKPCSMDDLHRKAYVMGVRRALNAEVWNGKWLAKLGDRHLADVGASPQFERGFRESAHESNLVPWRISEERHL